VREAYGKLYGRRHEDLFYAPPGTTEAEAKRLYGEWLADVEGRIAGIRAERKGEGISLTHRQARALAGEWYEWFVARHPDSEGETWESVRDSVFDALKAAAGDEAWEGEPRRRDELWKHDESLRKAVRPVLADVGETAQFLHSQRIVLNSQGRDLFLDNLYEDLAAALKRLIRNAAGDYSPDKYPERFPKLEGPGAGETPLQMFEAWARAKRPRQSTIESWRTVFRAMAAHFEDRSAASISPEDAQDWIDGLVTNERSARTVHNTWLAASKTVFTWAVKRKRLSSNSFLEVSLELPKKINARETRAFRPNEWRTILKASLAVSDTRTPLEAAKRWVPWLCGYTGARPGEITQLRKQDVFVQEGIHGLRFTPEAGSIKTGNTRVVPLHEHVIAQGFLEFIERHADGPLFYNPSRNTKLSDDPLKASKPPAAQMRQRLAAWVREIGIDDPALQPLHAWRHTFIQIGRRVGIPPAVLSTITGHAHKSVADEYGAASLEDMAEALKKFPRYEWRD
jgi:integrase